MINKRDFTYPSADKKTRIHAIEWIPGQEKPVKAVVQLIHGMVEYIDRYDRFARFLAEQGYYVVGNDHLGHGASVRGIDSQVLSAGEHPLSPFHGYFGKPNGNAMVIRDIDSLRMIAQEKYPEVPYFVLGHSMGSFLVQQYVELHGKGLSGMVVMGTAYQPKAALRLGQVISRRAAVKHGGRSRYRMLDQLALGANNKRFEPARTSADWLTKDTDIVDRYVQDPWNTFRFSVNAYENMFRGMEFALDDKNIAAIPDELPILFVSGDQDPVGNFGKGPQKMMKKYQKTGHKDLRLILYKNDRHEILNETDYEKVQEDLLQFFERASVC